MNTYFDIYLHKLQLNLQGDKDMQCKSCKNTVVTGELLGCPNCGATFCGDCAEKSFRICPYCYSDLEYQG